MPEFFIGQMLTAVASGRLGRRQDAVAALDALRRIFPASREAVRAVLTLWIQDGEVVERMMLGYAEAEALAAAPAETPRLPNGREGG
jgi:hypothetical protein